MTGHDNYTVFVNDPAVGNTTYELTDLNDGNSGVYIPLDKNLSPNNWFSKLFSDFHKIFTHPVRNNNAKQLTI